jgi:hypothetical protein
MELFISIMLIWAFGFGAFMFGLHIGLSRASATGVSADARSTEARR